MISIYNYFFSKDYLKNDKIEFRDVKCVVSYPKECINIRNKEDNSPIFNVIIPKVVKYDDFFITLSGEVSTCLFTGDIRVIDTVYNYRLCRSIFKNNTKSP